MSRGTTLLGAAVLASFVSVLGCHKGGVDSGGIFIIPPGGIGSISSVVPNSGGILGNTTISIIGSNFPAGSSARVGTIDLINVSNPNSSTVTGTIPAGNYAPGAVDVAVVVSAGNVAVLNGGYTFEVMQILGITPNTGPISGNVPVTITGRNFKNVPLSGVSLTNGSQTAILGNVVVNAAFTQIDAIVPPGLNLGTYNLVVQSTSHGTVTFTNAYSVGNGQSATMQISGIVSLPGPQSPAHGPLAGGTTVILTAAGVPPAVAPPGFLGTISVSMVLPGGTTVAAGGVVVSTTSFTNDTLTFVTPAAPGTFFGGPVTIRVDSSTQGFALASNGFTYDPVSTTPQINSISPATGPQGGGTNVTIQGINFMSGAVSNVRRVLIAGVPLLGLAVQSSTQLIGVTPGGPAGAVQVQIESTTGTLSNAVTFTYTVSLVLTRVSPNNGPVAGQNAITIFGANFTTATVASGSVLIGANPVTNVTVVNSGTLTGTAPAGNEGPADVTLLGGAGFAGTTLRQGYSYGPSFDLPKLRLTGEFNTRSTLAPQATGRALALGPVSTGLDAVIVNGTDNSFTVVQNIASLSSATTITRFTNVDVAGVLDNPLDVALADLDGDGATDIVILNGGPAGTGGPQSVVVLKNNGGGTSWTAFAAPTATSALTNFNTATAVSLDVADVNSDGIIDIAVAGAANATTNYAGIFIGSQPGVGQYTIAAGSVTALGGGDLGATKLKIVGGPGGLGDHCAAIARGIL